MESRLANLEGAYLQVADRLNGIDMRFDGLDRKIDGLDRKIDALRDSIATSFREVDRRFMWLIGMIVTSWVTTILAILLHR